MDRDNLVTYKCSNDTCTQFHDLEYMTYCPDCGILCPDCVIYEAVCFYCPICSFEVPSTTVKSEKARCNRQCFECPLCFNNLMTDVNEKGVISLQCSFCYYNSTGIVSFDKPTGMVSQFKKLQPKTLADEFAALKVYYENQISHLKKHPYSSNDLTPFTSSFTPLVDTAASGERSSTLTQHLAQPCNNTPYTNIMYPIQKALRSKKSKKCRQCDRMLVKPEGKTNSTKFTIASFARSILALDYKGMFDATQQPSSGSDEESWMYITLSNRMNGDSKVRVKLLDERCKNAEVSVVIPGFKGHNGMQYTCDILKSLCYADIKVIIKDNIAYIGIPTNLNNETDELYVEVAYTTQADKNDEYMCRIRV